MDTENRYFSADINEENVINDDNNDNKRKNRKRKKSFLQNARKYAKKGTFGRGSHLSEDTYQYFVNALELLRNGFENDEEKGIFVNNVLEQTLNEEVNYSRNQIGCRVIESLLPFANDEILQRYYTAFNDDLRPLLSDRFASHVIQALVKIAAFKGINYTPNQQDSNIVNSYQFAQKISKFLLNNLEDFVWDTYGNHIIRTVLESLSGIFENKDNKQKQSDFKDLDKSKLLPEFTEIVKEYGERLIQWPQFIDLPYEELTSGLVQILIISLRKVDSKLMKRVLKKLLEDSFLGDEYKKYIENEKQPPDDVVSIYGKRLPPVFDTEPSIRLLEVAIVNAKSKMFTQIYAKCFVNNLIQLAKTKNTNFTVQKLLNACTEKVEFEAIYDELAPEMENVFLTGHTGVILSIAQACKRLGSRQGQFTQNFMQSLHCNEPADKQINIVPLTLRMIPLDRLQKVIESEKNFNVNLHGSLIIQAMLEFNKPIKIINSLLNMELDDLKKLFCDTKGCHIMDSFMTSQFVGEKSREKLIRKLQGIYQDLASNKHGSRSFDALWLKTNLKQKHHIMDELCHKEAGWSNSEFGKIIAGKLNISLYKRNKDQWVASLNKVDKTKELFADIIGNV